MIVFTDASYNEWDGDILYAGIVVVSDGIVVDNYAVKLDRVNGENPEVTATMYARKRHAKATEFFSDFPSNRLATLVDRNHEHIRLCHSLANEARRGLLVDDRKKVPSHPKIQFRAKPCLRCGQLSPWAICCDCSRKHSAKVRYADKLA